MCFKDIAPKLFKMGYEPVPVTIGTKACFAPNWQTEDFTTEEMIRKYGAFNVGIRFNNNTPIVAVDIDVENETGKSEIEKILLDYHTPILRSGSPARLPSRIYSKPKGIISRKQHGIEVFANSGFIVLPPSSHPDYENHFYSWSGQSDLLSIDPDMIPELDFSLIRKLEAIGEKFPNVKKESTGSGYTQTRSKKGKYRNDEHLKVSAIAMKMASTGVNTREEIIEQLFLFDSNYSPEISYFESDYRKEWRGSKDKVRNANIFIDEILNRHKFELPKEKIVVDVSNIIKNEEANKIENFKPSILKKKERASFPQPKNGTYIELSIKNIVENSPKPKIKFAYFASIISIGHTLANSVEFNEFTSNMMGTLVGASGDGKNEPIKYPKTLMIESGLTDTIGVDEIGSSSFILDDLSYNRKRLYTIDEVSSLFSGIGQEGSYNENTGTTLSKLYSSGLSEFSGKGVKGSGAYGVCHSPAISLISGTTYTELRKTFKIENFGQGIGSRILFCFDEQKPVHRRISKRIIYDELKDFAKYYSIPFLPDTEHRRIPRKEYKPKKNEQPNENDMYLIITKPRPKRISTSREIEMAIDLFMVEMNEVSDKEENEIVKPIINRWYDIFSKVFIVSVYGNRDVLNWDMVATMDDFNFAKEFVLAYLDDCRIYLTKSIRHSKWVEEEEELMDIIRAAYKKKGAPLTKKDIKSSKFTGKYVESILVSLTLSEKIIYEPTKRGVKCSIVPCEIE